MSPFKVAEDARGEARTLLGAAVLAIVLSFVPYAQVLVYPFRLFVTFIHEGGHALATLLTGNPVHSLRVLPDGSGEVMSSIDGIGSGLLISSAGYLGATAYGALLLVLLRRKVAARIILGATAAFILAMTLRYGYGSAFTLVSGIGLSAVLLAAARYAQTAAANFGLSFVAVQCILNALFDLRTLLSLSAPGQPLVHTDAVNMAQATGIPAVVWAVIWIGVALVVLRAALRMYLAAPAPLASTSSA